MLRWRLILGTLIISALVGLCWLDWHAARPGVYLLPVAVAGTLLLAQEMLALVRAGGHQPLGWVVYLGSCFTVLASAGPMLWLQYPAGGPIGRLGWIAIGLAASTLLAIFGEIRNYRSRDQIAVNLALAVYLIVHSGGLMGFLVQLRLLGGSDFGVDGHWGMLALLSMIGIVKVSDTAAYFTGRSIGKHKFSPTISPGKTWEGAAGGLLFGVLTALLMLGPLASRMGCHTTRPWGMWLLGVVVYGFVVVWAGILGDLAASMLKRDAQVKDSSQWMPGFGGVLDLLDSLLTAAPVAYFCWAMGFVGP